MSSLRSSACGNNAGLVLSVALTCCSYVGIILMEHFVRNVCSRRVGGGGGGRICFLCCHIICDWFRGLVPIKPVQTPLHPVTSEIPSSVPHHRNQRSTGVRCWVSTLRVRYHPQTMQHNVSVLFRCSGINPTGTLPPPNHATRHFSAVQVCKFGLILCMMLPVCMMPPNRARLHGTLRASLSGTFLQTLPDLVTSLKGHSLSPHSCPPVWSAPSKRFGY